MFKKTLIAATLAALSTSAMAVDLETATGLAAAARTYGSEAFTSALIANDASSISLKPVKLTLGAEYTVGDTITITIAGGEFKTTGAAYVLTDVPFGTNETLSFGLLSTSATELLFRVTALTTAAASDSVLKNTVTLTDSNISAPGGAAPSAPVGGAVGDVMIKLTSTAPKANVVVTANAKTSTGLTIDTTNKDSATVGSVIAQHTFVVTTKMNAKIDVSKERKEILTPVVAPVTTPAFIITHTNHNPDQADFGSAASTVKLSVTGSMTGFETTVAGATNKGTVTGTGGAYTVATDLQSALSNLGVTSLLAASGIAAETVTFAVDTTPATRKVLNVSDYAFTAEMTESGKVVTVSGIAAGSMTLNGSSAQYAYAPVNYDGAVTTNFEIGNKGAVDGEISLTAFDTAGNDYSAILGFKAEAGKVTKVSDADIATAFALTKGTKLNLTITVNAPNADITYGAYSNRGTTGRMAINAVN